MLNEALNVDENTDKYVYYRPFKLIIIADAIFLYTYIFILSYFTVL